MKLADDILKMWGKCYEFENTKVEADDDNIKIIIQCKAPINKIDISFVARREVDKTVPPLKAQILTEGWIPNE